MPVEHPEAPADTSTLAMARLEAHYMKHAWFGANELLDSVPKFRHVPGAIVHGRYDMLCPVDAAVALAARHGRKPASTSHRMRGTQPSNRRRAGC